MNKPRTEISMSQQGIGSILKHHTLKVPSHQREYSWTKDQVRKLFQDLGKAISDDTAEYFLGTVATFKDGSALEVIDGQQRLATITILLCQIRNYLIAIKDDFLSASVALFLEYPDRIQRASMPKLQLNLSDNVFFADMIRAKTSTERPEPDALSHRLINETFDLAAEHVRTITAAFDPKDHGDVLNKWITFIEDRAEVILLQMPVGYNAYKMFETLNDRGLPTTQADLVKNYMFQQAERDNRLSEAETSWHKLKTLLDVVQDDKDITVIFMRCALILIHGPITKDEILTTVQSIAKGALQTLNLCRKFEGLAHSYAATFLSDHDKWSSYPDAIAGAIRTLNFFNIEPFRPVIVAISDKFKPNDALAAYKFLISLSVRIIIASSTSSGTIESVMHPAAALIFQGKIKTSDELKAAVMLIIPIDEKFQAAFKIATVSKSAFARYYLRTLERMAKKEPEPYFVINDDKEIIDLEHVLPKEPMGNYPSFSDAEAAIYTKRLGNLALHAKKINSDLKSKPFAEKRPMYKGCPYVLTSQLATVEGDWTPKLIEGRQAKMAELAVKTWRV